MNLHIVTTALPTITTLNVDSTVLCPGFSSQPVPCVDDSILTDPYEAVAGTILGTELKPLS